MVRRTLLAVLALALMVASISLLPHPAEARVATVVSAPVDGDVGGAPCSENNKLCPSVDGDADNVVLDVVEPAGAALVPPTRRTEYVFTAERVPVGAPSPDPYPPRA